MISLNNIHLPSTQFKFQLPCGINCESLCKIQNLLLGVHSTIPQIGINNQSYLGSVTNQATSFRVLSVMCSQHIWCSVHLQRVKYMDACYFMDILRKCFIIQLNPSTLCLKGKRKHSFGPSPSSKNSAKSLLLPFLSDFNFLANIARQTKQFISVLHVEVNVEESVLQLAEF